MAQSSENAITSNMRTPLHELESHLLRGAVETARVLGVSYSNYAAMKAGTRQIPAYIRGHVEALMALDDSHLNALIRRRLDGC